MGIKASNTAEVSEIVPFMYFKHHARVTSVKLFTVKILDIQRIGNVSKLLLTNSTMGKYYSVAFI